MSNPSQSDQLLMQKPFRFYIRHFRRLFALGITSLFFTNLFDVLNPLALKWAIDFIYQKDVDNLKLTIIAYASIMGALALFRYLWRYYFGQFHHSVAEDLRNRIFDKLTHFGPSFYQKKPVGELMSLITNDVNSFRMAIGPGTLILIDGAFLVLMILPLMVWLSWSWTWKTLILLPLVPFAISKIEKMIHERFREQQDRLSEVSASAQEIVSGVRVIKGYAQENNQTKQFDRLSQRYEVACNRMSKVDAVFEPVMEFAVASGSVILLYFCTPELIRNGMSIGTFVAFHEYIKKMVWPMSALGAGVSMIQQGRASFDRIRELLQSPTDIPDHGQIELTEFKNLEVKNLSFSYASSPQPVLRDVSFRIEAGETIGIVGPVGAGKSTLMQVICRLFPVDEGCILFNGHSVEKIRQANLRQLISYVPQEAFLFSDTINENVALGLLELPDKQPVRDVARLVNIEAEIESLPEQYESYLGERGVNLSGGQKQRLTIARALIRSSPVVILDDSLSAVDGKTEKSLIAELKSALSLRQSKKFATLLVSHRLASLRHADKILVLNSGVIEAMGTHDWLVANNSTYRQLDELQNSQRLQVSFDASALVKKDLLLNTDNEVVK